MVSVPLIILLATANADCRLTCASDTPICVATCLIDTGEPRRAIDLLKSSEPSAAVRSLLARAYLADGNRFWAMRTLHQILADDPDDCGQRGLLAWLYVGEKDPATARDLLAHEVCPRAGGAEQTRWHLLTAMIALADADEATATAAVERAGDASVIYDEDLAILSSVQRTSPGWIDPLSLHLRLEGGFTTNAAAGSPMEARDAPGSPLLRLDASSRWMWPKAGWLRASLELGFKAHLLSSDDSSDLSYLEPNVRPAVIVGTGYPRALIGYEGSVLLLNRGGGGARKDVGTHLYDAHRIEVELEPTNSTLLFAGAGRRRFIFDTLVAWEMAAALPRGRRTRWEVDAGAGTGVHFGNRVRLMTAIAARYFNARIDAYDQIGGTALAVTWVSLTQGFDARASAMVASDYFLSSGGAFGITEKRFDLLVKVSAGLWSPRWVGGRLGVTYELARRESNADNISNDPELPDYSYLEHRIFAALQWRVDLDPWAPAAVVGDGDYVPIDWGVAPDSAGGDEHLRDLLRQDEDVRAGCGCAE